MLPIGFDRENNKDYEEVNIPPSDPPPVHIGKNLVPISQLDEVLLPLWDVIYGHLYLINHVTGH